MKKGLNTASAVDNRNNYWNNIPVGNNEQDYTI